jgi:hypothetical protein
MNDYEPAYAGSAGANAASYTRTDLNEGTGMTLHCIHGASDERTALASTSGQPA